jgi:hypothetical protein
LKVAGASALGIAGAVAAGGADARASTGNPVLAGNSTTAEDVTEVVYDASANPGVILLAQDGPFVASESLYSAALGGWASGTVTHGVYGYTDAGTGNAVIGEVANTVGAGVLGITQSGGTSTGVTGQAYGAGAAGVHAMGSGNATALKVSGSSTFTGTTTFSRSGKLTIAAGSHSASKTGINLTSSSLVLATVQGATNAGVLNVVPTVSSTPNTSSFVVNLTANATSAVTVAWFILS